MNEATYQCQQRGCKKDHRKRFQADYKILQKWFEQCPHCGKYGLHKLVGIKDSEGKVIPLLRWIEVCR